MTVIEDERQKVERLQEGRSEETERELKQQIAAYLEAQKQIVEREAKALIEALKTENNQLKTESNQFQQKISKQTKSLISVSGNVSGSVAIYAPINQHRENREEAAKIERLSKQCRQLEDEIAAARQISAETQLRQLNELRSLTKEIIDELRQMLTELQHQQQQQPAVEEHLQGKYINSLLLVV